MDHTDPSQTVSITLSTWTVHIFRTCDIKFSLCWLTVIRIQLEFLGTQTRGEAPGDGVLDESGRKIGVENWSKCFGEDGVDGVRPGVHRLFIIRDSNLKWPPRAFGSVERGR